MSQPPYLYHVTYLLECPESSLNPEVALNAGGPLKVFTDEGNRSKVLFPGFQIMAMPRQLESELHIEKLQRHLERAATNKGFVHPKVTITDCSWVGWQVHAPLIYRYWVRLRLLFASPDGQFEAHGWSGMFRSALISSDEQLSRVLDQLEPEIMVAAESRISPNYTLQATTVMGLDSLGVVNPKLG